MTERINGQNQPQTETVQQQIDFSTGPEGGIIRYTPSDKPPIITRNNFADFITLSFSVSRGNTVAQNLFFRWISAKTHQNIEALLKDFQNAGGFNCLSEEEKKHITSDFLKVKKHSELSMENQENGPERALRRDLSPQEEDERLVNILETQLPQQLQGAIKLNLAEEQLIFNANIPTERIDKMRFATIMRHINNLILLVKKKEKERKNEKKDLA